MSKKRGFFRGYRHGNRSMPKLLGARDTESTPSDSKSMLEIALDKANTAVLYDQADDFDAAIRSYKEAVGLLEGFFDTAGTEDRTRLQKIVSKSIMAEGELLRNKGEKVPSITLQIHSK